MCGTFVEEDLILQRGVSLGFAFESFSTTVEGLGVRAVECQRGVAI
jgi:hypothetical protein